jgi:outer membrane protein assembly factor BamB
VLFVPGVNGVMAYDAYNGLKLWERTMPNTTRTAASHEASNMAADDQSLFVVEGDHCVRLDAISGQLMTAYTIPKAEDKTSRRWGYLAVYNGFLYGSSAKQDRFCDQLFGIDLTSGQTAWIYNGNNIPHTTLSLGDGRVFLADKGAGSKPETKPTKKKMQFAAFAAEKASIYESVALDARTGAVAWRKPLDLTGCVGGLYWSSLATMYQGGTLLYFGIYTDGHYWKDFFGGQFDSRRIVAVAGSDGKEIWSRKIGYRVRPLIIGSTLHAEPWAYKLSTGEQILRTNPITGQEEPWQFARPGHHCGGPVGSMNTLFFRSYNIAYYDLVKDSGTVHFGAQRPGCWINFILANGLVMIPEASSGCMCAFPNMCTVVFKSRAEDRAWTKYSLAGESLPVKHLAVNLGAPGDRRDSAGTMWLGYPRAGGSLVLPVKADLSLFPGGEYFQMSPDFTKVTGTTDPWLYTFGLRGMKTMSLPLRRAQDCEARYTVRLAFAALEQEKSGQRIFDVQLQGQTVAKGFDVVKEAGAVGKAMIKEFQHVAVKEALDIQLVPVVANPSRDQLPVLQAVEVLVE